MQQKKAVIIGSGIAGIATSIRLASAGYAVTVFEKNSYPGGKLSAFEQNGFLFDAGPSLFTQPQYVQELFDVANVDMAPYFSYSKSDVTCQYFFADGKKVTGYAEKEKFADELATQFQEDKNKTLQYLQHSKTAFENIGTLFTQFSLHKLKTYAKGRMWRAIGATKLPYLFKTLHSYNKQYFTHKNTVQLFDRFATYNGSNPYKAPAMLSMIPHFEMNEGTFFPKGGMVNITNALVALAKKKGVQFELNSTVSKICVENKKAIGIVANNKNIETDVVISNMDIYYTYLHLLQNKIAAQKILRQERSSSAFIFYWGVKHTFPELHLHNIFFSKNYKQEFVEIFTENKLPADPTIYINMPNSMEPGLAPNGCSNWFVMVNAPAHTGQNWQQNTTDLRNIIIEKLNNALQVNLEPLIITEAILTPADIETKTSSFQGSLYGSSSNSKFAAFLRQKNKSSQYKNLYFVGGSVHPGGGIPLCLGSANIVSQLIVSSNK